MLDAIQANWQLIVAATVAVSSLLVAVLPQGEPGSFLDMFRKLLNWLAINKRNARNIDTNAGG